MPALALEKLCIAGYRAIPPARPVCLELRPFSLIVGPNSVSKTSILEALYKGLLGESIGTLDDTYKSLGTDVTIDVGLRTELDRQPLPLQAEEKLREKAAQLIAEYILAEDEKPFGYVVFGPDPLVSDVARCVVDAVQSLLGEALAAGTVLSLTFSVDLEGDRLVARNAVLRGFGEKLYSHVYSRCESLQKLIKETKDATVFKKKFIEEIGAFTGLALLETLRARLSDLLHYVGSARLLATSVLDVSEGIGRLLYTSFPDPEVSQRLLRWLGLAGRYTRLRLIPEVRGEKPVARVEVYDGYVGEWIPLDRAAGGLRFVLPVLAVLAAAEKGSVVIIDDLELGLHPAAQRSLVDAVVEAVKRGIQVIATTHSSMVLLRSLHAVYRKELSAEDVVVNVVYRDEDGVYAEAIPPRLPLRLSEKARKSLKKMGAIDVFGEEGELAMELAKSLAD